MARLTPSGHRSDSSALLPLPRVCLRLNSSSQSFSGTDMKRREFIRALGGAATATIGAFGIRLRQLIGYDRLRSQPA
jgi:hypothetical protein